MSRALRDGLALGRSEGKFDISFVRFPQIVVNPGLPAGCLSLLN